MSDTTENQTADEPIAAAEDVPTSAPAGADAAEPTDGAARPNARKVREGIVASTSMDKTIVVEVVDRVRHRRYAKTVQRTKRLHVHDETNDASAGDRVRVQETRPLSKLKRWRLVEVLERAR